MDKQAITFGTWVPPLLNTHKRLLEFSDQAKTVGATKDAYEKFSNAASMDAPEYFFFELSPKLKERIRNTPAWNYNTELSNIFLTLIQNDLLKRVTITSETSPAPKSVKISVSGHIPALQRGITQPNKRSKDYLNGNFDDEISLQHEYPELFVLRAAEVAFKIKPNELKLICSVWDVIQNAVIEVSQTAKKLTTHKRPPPPYSVTLPAHSTWPGGHAVAASSLVVLISMILNLKRSTNPDPKKLYGFAYRIAWNRERAGLHWEEDTSAGLEIGAYIVKALFSSLEQMPNSDLFALLNKR